MAMPAVEFARSILDMQETIEDQQREINRLRWYETEYHALMDASLAHSKEMVGQTLRLLMTPGVVEACQASAPA